MHCRPCCLIVIVPGYDIPIIRRIDMMTPLPHCCCVEHGSSYRRIGTWEVRIWQFFFFIGLAFHHVYAGLTGLVGCSILSQMGAHGVHQCTFARGVSARTYTPLFVLTQKRLFSFCTLKRLFSSSYRNASLFCAHQNAALHFAHTQICGVDRLCCFVEASDAKKKVTVRCVHFTSNVKSFPELFSAVVDQKSMSMMSTWSTPSLQY